MVENLKIHFFFREFVADFKIGQLNKNGKSMTLMISLTGYIIFLFIQNLEVIRQQSNRCSKIINNQSIHDEKKEKKKIENKTTKTAHYYLTVNKHFSFQLVTFRSIIYILFELFFSFFGSNAKFQKRTHNISHRAPKHNMAHVCEKKKNQQHFYEQLEIEFRTIRQN